MDRVELPHDRGGGVQPSAGRLELVTTLDAEVLVGLTRLAANASPALLAAGLAVLDILLYKYTQQSALSIGVPGQGDGSRCSTVHCAVSDDARFVDLMEHIRDSLGAESSAGATSNVFFGVSKSGGRSALPSYDFASADLGLIMDVTEGGTLRLSYRSDLFHAERMIVLLEHYQFLLCAAVADPQKCVLDFTLDAEVDRRIRPDPSISIDQPVHPAIGDLVARWADQTPDAPAVHQAGRTWTYRQLMASATRIATALTRLGVRQGEVVAVTGKRSFALVSAMLGVFRGGYTLLTLDPALPQGRRQIMLEGADAKAVVFVGASSAGDQVETADRQCVFVDSETADVADLQVSASSTESLQLPAIDPEWPAYVFFTSGSTGTPKAVLGRHKGLSHFLCWQREAFGILPQDRAAQLTALSFDVVLRDTFLALTSGASLCIPEETDVIDPARILPWLQRERVSVLHVVPSLARLWLNHVPAGFRLHDLRRVFFAGEPLMDGLVSQAYELCAPDAEVINLYGPTETTLAKCFSRVSRSPEPGVQPIGSPLPQTQVLILDKQRRLCGAGEIGEIAIRTPFRTLGYFNAPELTAKVFIPNPFRKDPDDLIYLTGDNGRYRWDGVLEILGRMDNQIKIRGVRIEPGEIEAMIGRHPNVREVVIVARETGSQTKILVAYVALRESGGPGAGKSIEELREYARARLPEIMVPSAFVVLEALPLNANGKVDKKSLPDPDRASMVGKQHAEPTDALEASLKGVWESVLGLQGIGIDDPFFDIGGHSLLAVQLVNAISSRMGLACTLPMLYTGGTIRSLAAAMRDGTAGDRKEWTVLALQPSGWRVPLFCISGIHLYSELARELSPDIPVYGIYLSHEQELFKDAAERRARPLSIEEIAAGYLRAVREVQPDGPYCLAGVSFGGVVAYEIAQQLASQGERVEFLALLDTMLPSVVKRNWIKWLVARFRSARAHGMASLIARIKRRIGTVVSATTDSIVGDETRTTSEIERLWAIRDQAYRDAELRYRPGFYAGNAVLVRAKENFRLESDTADPETYGWRDHISRLETLDVSGDHLGILRAPNVAELASGLRPYLDRVRQTPLA